MLDQHDYMLLSHESASSDQLRRSWPVTWCQDTGRYLRFTLHTAYILWSIPAGDCKIIRFRWERQTRDWVEWRTNDLHVVRHGKADGPVTRDWGSSGERGNGRSEGGSESGHGWCTANQTTKCSRCLCTYAGGTCRSSAHAKWLLDHEVIAFPRWLEYGGIWVIDHSSQAAPRWETYASISEWKVDSCWWRISRVDRLRRSVRRIRKSLQGVSGELCS